MACGLIAVVCLQVLDFCLFGGLQCSGDWAEIMNLVFGSEGGFRSAGKKEGVP